MRESKPPKINEAKMKRILRSHGICECGFDRLGRDWEHCTRCRCKVGKLSDVEEIGIKLRITVGEERFSFGSFREWVNKGAAWYSQRESSGRDLVSIDKLGRICRTGREFERAKDEKAFPVRVFYIL